MPRTPQHEASVQELADQLGTTHQNLSRHLKMLYSSGIVTRRPEGNRVHYALGDYTACLIIRQAIASVAGHIEELADLLGLEP
jgi:DNA-binding transcriptional ArsR family regulator